jgi:glycosyl transferase family 25
MQRSTARRRHIERQFTRLGWSAVYIEGVDGRDLDQATLDRDGLLHPDHEGLSGRMAPGEIGCAMSHMQAWQLVTQARAGYALICEDDIVLPAKLDLWALLRWVPGDADLLYLHYLNDQNQDAIGPAFDSEHDRPIARAGAYSFFRAWSCGGTACYIVSREAARTLLHHARPLRFPSDGLMARLTANSVLRAYALWPRPVALHPFRSTIR